METVLLIIKALATVEPIIADAVPVVESLIAGSPVTSAQMVTLWTAIAALEEKNATAAAAVEAGPAA